MTSSEAEVQVENIRSIKLFQFFQVAGWGSFAIFFPVYMVGCGISLAEVGIIMAVPVIVGVFTAIMWSSLSDAIGRRKPFLVQSTVLLALYAFAVTLVSSFEGFLILGVIRALFTPMVEGLVVTSLFRSSGYQGRATAFSGFAIWGSVGWATATSLAGVLVWVFGIKAAFYFSCLLFVLAMAVSLRIPEEVGGAGGPPRAPAPALARPRPPTGHFAPLRELLMNSKLRVLLLASFPLFLAINAAERFFPIYLDSSGASSILIGLIFTLPVIVEVPVFLKVGKLSDRIGARKPLLIFSAATYALLFLLFVLISNPLALLLVYPLLAPLAWPPLITGSATLVSEIVPRESWVTGQTLLTVWMWSICGILGPLMGGFISNAWGLQSMFAVTSVLAAVSALSFRAIRERSPEFLRGTEG